MKLLTLRTENERFIGWYNSINRQIQIYIKNGCHRDIDLSYSPITKLPDNLTQINGDLCLNSSNIKYIPNGLTVNGSLWLRKSNIINLPDNLTIEGSLSISNTYINELPKNLIIRQHFYYYNTPLTKNKTEKYIKRNCFVGGTLIGT